MDPFGMKDNSELHTVLPHISAGFAACVAGSSVVCTAIVMQSLNPIEATFLRYAVAFICILPFCWLYWKRFIKISPKDFFAILFLGLMFFFTFPFTFNKALQLTTAAHGALILAVLPSLSLLFGVFFRVEKLNYYKLIGCIIAVAGVAIGVSSGLTKTAYSTTIIFGDIIMFLAIIQGAAFTVISKKYFERYGSWLVCILAIALAFIVPAPVILSTYGLSWLLGVGQNELLLIFFLGSLGVPVQFGLFAWSISKLGPSRASMYIVLTPLSGTALAIIILGETVTVNFLIGLFFVTSAIYIANQHNE